VNNKHDEGQDALRRLKQETDRLLLELMGADRLFPHAPATFRPKTDMFFDKTADAIIVKLELAGIDPDSVVLEARERILHVRGERLDSGRAGRVYQQMEIDYGPFERRLGLPAEVDPTEAKAHYEDGFLEIVLPVAASKGVRSIPVDMRESNPVPSPPVSPGSDPLHAHSSKD
jgi:HSP20 family protein